MIHVKTVGILLLTLLGFASFIWFVMLTEGWLLVVLGVVFVLTLLYYIIYTGLEEGEEERAQGRAYLAAQREWIEKIKAEDAATEEAVQKSKETRNAARRD